MYWFTGILFFISEFTLQQQWLMVKGHRRGKIYQTIRPQTLCARYNSVSACIAHGMCYSDSDTFDLPSSHFRGHISSLFLLQNTRPHQWYIDQRCSGEDRFHHLFNLWPWNLLIAQFTRNMEYFCFFWNHYQPIRLRYFFFGNITIILSANKKHCWVLKFNSLLYL